MKLILLLAVACVALASPSDFYAIKDDPSFVEIIVNDPDKLKALNDCYFDRGACDPVAKSYKDVIPDALEHACKRCTDNQKHIANLYIRSLASTPEEQENFVKKYDPQGQYLQKFAAAVKDY